MEPWDSAQILKKLIVENLQGSYVGGIYYPDKTRGMVEKWLPRIFCQGHQRNQLDWFEFDH